jgi:cellulose 1,4-beta-cellobiosidase
VIQNSNTNIAGITPTNHISNAFCTAEKNALGGPDAFASQDSMAGIGQAPERRIPYVEGMQIEMNGMLR